MQGLESAKLVVHSLLAWGVCHLTRERTERQTGQIDVSTVWWEHRGRDWASLTVQQGFLDEMILNTIPSVTKSRKSALTSLGGAESHRKVLGQEILVPSTLLGKIYSDHHCFTDKETETEIRAWHLPCVTWVTWSDSCLQRLYPLRKKTNLHFGYFEFEMGERQWTEVERQLV